MPRSTPPSTGCRRWASRASVCVSPGNHDAYVPGALGRALKRWDGYVQGETVSTQRLPLRAAHRRHGDHLAARARCRRPPWMASGRFSANQAARLARILKLLGDGGYFRVVLIHHPPDKESCAPAARALGRKRFREVIAEHGAELILHGHTHKSSMHAVPGPKGEVPVVGVAAAGAAQDAAHGDDPGPLQPLQDRAGGHGVVVHHAGIRLSAAGHARSCCGCRCGFIDAVAHGSRAYVIRQSSERDLLHRLSAGLDSASRE